MNIMITKEDQILIVTGLYLLIKQKERQKNTSTNEGIKNLLDIEIRTMRSLTDKILSTELPLVPLDEPKKK